ncbi:hypothetical protein HDU67_007239 [Dinochytrium kinnereticum]|nr:hypothetical protein HDU67_007239 [Dinochytrium kinnereticum]
MAHQVSLTCLSDRMNGLETSCERLKAFLDETAENQMLSDSLMVQRCANLRKEVDLIRQAELKKDGQISMLIELVLYHRDQFNDITARLEALEHAERRAGAAAGVVGRQQRARSEVQVELFSDFSDDNSSGIGDLETGEIIDWDAMEAGSEVLSVTSEPTDVSDTESDIFFDNGERDLPLPSIILPTGFSASKPAQPSPTVTMPSTSKVSASSDLPTIFPKLHLPQVSLPTITPTPLSTPKQHLPGFVFPKIVLPVFPPSLPSSREDLPDQASSSSSHTMREDEIFRSNVSVECNVPRNEVVEDKVGGMCEFVLPRISLVRQDPWDLHEDLTDDEYDYEEDLLSEEDVSDVNDIKNDEENATPVEEVIEVKNNSLTQDGAEDYEMETIKISSDGNDPEVDDKCSGVPTILQAHSTLTSPLQTSAASDQISLNVAIQMVSLTGGLVKMVAVGFVMIGISVIAVAQQIARFSGTVIGKALEASIVVGELVLSIPVVGRLISSTSSMIVDAFGPDAGGSPVTFSSVLVGVGHVARALPFVGQFIPPW